MTLKGFVVNRIEIIQTCRPFSFDTKSFAFKKETQIYSVQLLVRSKKKSLLKVCWPGSNTEPSDPQLTWRANTSDWLTGLYTLWQSSCTYGTPPLSWGKECTKNYTISGKKQASNSFFIYHNLFISVLLEFSGLNMAHNWIERNL